MWVESVLIVADQIMNAAELDGWRLSVGACDLAALRMLLAHVTLTEDQASCQQNSLSHGTFVPCLVSISSCQRQ